MIGAGNVATHLSRALEKSGFAIVSVYSRTLEHAQLLASSLAHSVATNDFNALPNVHIYIFCIKDDILPSLVERLAVKMSGSENLVLHTAGSIPLSAISDHFKNAAVLYPMQTFSRTRDVDFSKIPLFVEGSNEHSMRLVSQIAVRLSSSVAMLDSRRRRLLHLASVFACNFTNHCYALASEILHEADISPKILLPLIDETARKIHELSPVEAQTGPAARWDENVMKSQVQLLKDNQERILIYKAMSHSIHSLNMRYQFPTQSSL